MLAGVVSHAADVIGPEKWIYNSKHYQNEAINLFIHITHLFRMETFFVLAGFFSCLVINRKSKDCFIRNRINRVLIPLLSSIALISSFQILFTLKMGIATTDEISLSRIISHLWFLQTLLILSILLVLLPIEKIKSALNKASKRTLAAILLFIALLPYGIIFLSIQIFQDNANLQDITDYYIIRTLHFGLYFSFGYALYANESLFARSIKINKMLLLCIFAISTGILLYIRHLSIHGTELITLAKPSIAFLELASALSASILLISIFTTHKFSQSATTSFLVRSSIAIYLFHHPIMIVSSYYMDIPGFNSYTYFISICLVTYALSFAVFLLIDRSPITRKLFGIPAPGSSTFGVQRNTPPQPERSSTPNEKPNIS